MTPAQDVATAQGRCRQCRVPPYVLPMPCFRAALRCRLSFPDCGGREAHRRRRRQRMCLPPTDGCRRLGRVLCRYCCRAGSAILVPQGTAMRRSSGPYRCSVRRAYCPYPRRCPKPEIRRRFARRRPCVPRSYRTSVRSKDCWRRWSRQAAWRRGRLPFRLVIAGRMEAGFAPAAPRRPIRRCV